MKPLPCHDGYKENLLGKRWVCLQGSETKAEETREEKETDIGEKKILEHLGKKTPELNEAIDKAVALSDADMKKALDDWELGIGSLLEGGARKIFSMTGKVNTLYKKQIDDQLQKIAVDQANAEAKKYFESDTGAQTEYAKSSLNILSFKIEASEKLAGNLRMEIQDLEQRQKIIQKANKGIFSLSKAFDFIGEPLTGHENIRQKIKRLKEAREHTESIRRESREKMKLRAENKEKKIEEWHQSLLSIVMPNIKATNDKTVEEQKAKFETLLRDAVLGNYNAESELFSKYIDGIQNSSERVAARNLCKYLMNGNRRSFLRSTEGRIADFIGAISSADTQNYFRRRLVEVGKINEKSLSEKINYIKNNAKIGQKIKIGEKEYTLMRKDAEGFMLMSEPRKMAFLTTKDPKKPILTMQTDGSEEKPTFSRAEIDEKSTVSKNTMAVEFALKKVEKTEGKKEEGKETKKVERRQGLLERIKNVFKRQNEASK
ncbi:MAG: hypothetical protein Q8O95_05145 [bacterium]|nr:hypothetical protein [bacterium]